MDEDLQARVAALRASRRAGANAPPPEDWVVYKHFHEIDSAHVLAEREHGSFDKDKLTVVSVPGHGSRSALMTFAFRFPTECNDAFVGRNAPTVAQVLAVSTIDALMNTVVGQEGLSFSMKCPNEILANNRAIAFVTTSERLLTGSRPDWIIVSVDVSLNVPECEHEQSKDSLQAIAGDACLYDIEAFRKRLATTFAVALGKLFVNGFTTFVGRVNSVEAHVGDIISFSISGKGAYEGTYLGINESGHALIKGTKDVSGKDTDDTCGYPRGEIMISTSKPRHCEKSCD